ncbi:unnamed protein product [Calypogeia fissa]
MLPGYGSTTYHRENLIGLGLRPIEPTYRRIVILATAWSFCRVLLKRSLCSGGTGFAGRPRDFMITLDWCDFN